MNWWNLNFSLLNQNNIWVCFCQVKLFEIYFPYYIDTKCNFVQFYLCFQFINVNVWYFQIIQRKGLGYAIEDSLLPEYYILMWVIQLCRQDIASNYSRQFLLHLLQLNSTEWLSEHCDIVISVATSDCIGPVHHL